MAATETGNDTQSLPQSNESPLEIKTINVDALTEPFSNVVLCDEASQTDLESENSLAAPRPLRTYTRSQLLFLHNSPLVKSPDDMPELKDWFGTENEQNLNKRELDSSSPSNTRDRRYRRDIDDGDTTSRPSFRPSMTQPSQMGNFKHQSIRNNDRDREGDLRDKDGLRNLSDKFDRDRMGLPLPSLRNKERDPVPHLPAGSSRLTQSQLTPSGRRQDNRETSKKKGEVSEDWRRGTESRRPLREERPERDDRERPRSRVRDSSRPRRDPSTSRKDDRDRHREDPRKDKDVYQRDRERDDYRRDRDRDADDFEEDPRRWRDDGKRDERLAARRERDRDNRGRDRPPHERGAWTLVEEKDSRSKRNTARDRKPPGGGDEGREDRRDREREKEKEPAWMDTYIPPPSSAGILGGKSTDGELDGIQAWKKGMKEKEQKDKDTSRGIKDVATSDSATPADQPVIPDSGMDEIQLFKMLMKREQEQKHSPHQTSVNSGDQPPALVPTGGKAIVHPSNALLDTVPTSEATRPSESLLSILTSVEPTSRSPATPNDKEISSTSSRFFPHRVAQQESAPQTPIGEPSSSSFNAPQGSRLLALGSRPPAKANSPTLPPPTQFSNGAAAPLAPISKPPLHLDLSGNSAVAHDVLRSYGPGFSPFEEQSRISYGLDDRELGSVDAIRRASAEQRVLQSEVDAATLESANAGYPSGKGSRFAKFFDGKAAPKSQPPLNYSSGSPGPGLRQESFNHVPEQRTIDDIFAMLNSSQQTQRTGHLNPPNSAPTSSNMSFGHQAQNQLHLLQQTQNLHPPNRLEPLYESQLDNRNFVPDGMVPGLRSAPPPRGRDNGNLYNDHLDDPIVFPPGRLPPQQHRGLDQLYSAPSNTMYSQQNARNVGIPIQPPYRGGPSPLASQHAAQLQQRLPPGLANLGGRPPHEPSQFLGVPGMSSASLHGPLHNQQFNYPQGSGNIGFQGQQLRGPSNAPQLHNPVLHQQLANLGHPSNLDLRTGQNPVLLGGLRGPGSGAFPSPGNPQIHSPALSVRQQQHMMHHAVTPHLQHQGPPLPSNQAQDLMALLMGGPRRD